ncbi:hypothetical protein CA262_07835 [Sphingobium sp. GW456-12-10-14-TSB1]|uniref:Uncharacterized protein n=1 Tax=Sphingobium xenophagum TaxID=121428 RepID=A0A249MVM9_SPHXE|nr:hypothetical protein CJD35_13910 [Sphingobium xenophagum]OUC54775.1 hypothetical protein CA262_07835 [Sphingobium sp. GW456-12-10-14-TSB1]
MVRASALTLAHSPLIQLRLTDPPDAVRLHILLPQGEKVDLGATVTEIFSISRQKLRQILAS